MQNKNLTTEDNSPVNDFYNKNFMLLALVVFILFITYKYTSSNIQENKEKDVIQERAKTQEAIQPQQEISKKTRSPIKAVLPNVAGFCSTQNEVNMMQEWVHACYLQDLLTAQCKKIFDVNGYYLTGDYDSFGDPNGYVDTYTYLNNADICKCRLPADIGNRINSSFESGALRCK